MTVETAKWSIKKVPARIRKGGKQRAFVWEVTCPAPPPELTWENDFGRGMRCGCRRFPTEGKATRYVERMEGATVTQETTTEDSFDRTVCPPPCNTMHSYADGERTEPCAHETGDDQ